jgi:hypothetical protein
MIALHHGSSVCLAINVFGLERSLAFRSKLIPIWSRMT